MEQILIYLVEMPSKWDYVSKEETEVKSVERSLTCKRTCRTSSLTPPVYSVDLEVSRVVDPDVLQCPTFFQTQPWL